jgi:hypothetical protein
MQTSGAGRGVATGAESADAAFAAWSGGEAGTATSIGGS